MPVGSLVLLISVPVRSFVLLMSVCFFAGMGGCFLSGTRLGLKDSIWRKFDCDKNFVFVRNKNFVHALIWTCRGGNVFSYYTIGQSRMQFLLSLFLPMRSVIGNKHIFLECNVQFIENNNLINCLGSYNDFFAIVCVILFD